MEPKFFIEMSLSSESEAEEEAMVIQEEPPKAWGSTTGNAMLSSSSRRRLLSKQLSMRETTREANWERRRRQILHRRSKTRPSIDEADDENYGAHERVMRSLTDEDLDELRGSIELGFGFSEERGGHHLCNTLPALDLYFAVNRQFSDSKMSSSPPTRSLTACSSSKTLTASSSSSNLFGSVSPRSPYGDQQPSGPSDSFKMFCPDNDPQYVKTRLRHWAQAVACSIRQCS